MNCLVLFVAISAVLINSAYGISLRTKINAVTIKKAMVATTSDFQEHVGACRTSNWGSGNPYKKNVEPEDCKKICLSDPGCTAIETEPGTRQRSKKFLYLKALICTGFKKIYYTSPAGSVMVVYYIIVF